MMLIDYKPSWWYIGANSSGGVYRTYKTAMEDKWQTSGRKFSPFVVLKCSKHSSWRRGPWRPKTCIDWALCQLYDQKTSTFDVLSTGMALLILSHLQPLGQKPFIAYYSGFRHQRHRIVRNTPDDDDQGQPEKLHLPLPPYFVGHHWASLRD